MLTTTLALLTATTFAATVLHLKSWAKPPEIAISELWKIRAYQEDDARSAIFESIEEINQSQPEMTTQGTAKRELV